MSLSWTLLIGVSFPGGSQLTSVRAPTRSSLNKQKKSSNERHVRRRSVIPDGARADERLGLSSMLSYNGC